MTTGPTAPVPPDANGLREAVEALADQWEKNAGTDRDSESHTLRAVVAYLRALLAAPEAAPTAGERLCGPCRRGQTHLCDGNDYVPCDLPATPPDDDANEGLSGGDRELIWRAVAETPCGPLHAEFGWTPGEACSKCEDRADELMPFLTRQVERVVAARESAAATRARAEGAVDALREAAKALRSDGKIVTARWLRDRADSIARSDAAPHTGDQP